MKSRSPKFTVIFTMSVVHLFVFPWISHPVGVAQGASVPNLNLALHKPATQSSTNAYYLAPFAVDGDTMSDMGQRRCAQTIHDYDTTIWHWWQVDLLANFTIQSVRLLSAENPGYQNELSKFTIEVSLDDPASLAGFPGYTSDEVAPPVVDVCVTMSGPIPVGVPTTYTCDQPVIGRYIRVVKSNLENQPLSICEFEAYSYVERNFTQYDPTPSGENLALNKPASQSSTLDHNDLLRAADLAVDGNLDARFESDSCSATTSGNEETHWWMVDLEEYSVINSIRLVTRLDCCQDRLQNFTIEVSVEEPSTLVGFPGHTQRSEVCHQQIDIVPYHAPATYTCDRPAFGRYVRVVKTGREQLLTLCEFEVLGRSLSANNWSFAYVAGKRTDGVSGNPGTDQRLMTNCARKRAKGNRDVALDRFIYIDLTSGACRFYQTLTEALHDSSGDNWVLYCNLC